MVRLTLGTHVRLLYPKVLSRSANTGQGLVPFPMSPNYGVAAQAQSSHGNPYQGNAPQIHSSYSQYPDVARDKVCSLSNRRRGVVAQLTQHRQPSEQELAQAENQWSTVNEQSIRLNEQCQRSCTMLNEKELELS